MINEIIDGISNALNEEFGDTYEIYTESIEQGLTEPCFFIQCIGPSNSRVLKDRYFSTNLFSIQYFPSTQEPFKECNNVLERLYNCLNCIAVSNDAVYSSKIDGNVNDNVLTVTITYSMYISIIKTINNEMESFEANTDVGG